MEPIFTAARLADCEQLATNPLVVERRIRRRPTIVAIRMRRSAEEVAPRDERGFHVVAMLVAVVLHAEPRLEDVVIPHAQQHAIDGVNQFCGGIKVEIVDPLGDDEP